MRPKRITLSAAALDRDGVCAAQQAAGAGNLTIDGALASGGVATLDIARHVSVYSAGNLTAVTFSVTGTDRFGNAITEDITGPNATTVTGAKNFKTVTQVAVDGAVGTDAEVGSADEFETQWIPLERSQEVGTIQVEFASGAGMTWAFQTTADDLQVAGFQENDAATTVDGTLTGQTASARGSDIRYATGARIAVTSFTSGGFTATLIQPGL